MKDGIGADVVEFKRKAAAKLKPTLALTDRDAFSGVLIMDTPTGIEIVRIGNTSMPNVVNILSRALSLL